MSSPIHQVDDLDPSLRYAPPWARRQGSLSVEMPFAPPCLPQQPGDYPEYEQSDSTAARAMAELQRQFTLNPDIVPEPPQEGTLWPIVLRTCAVAGVAAIVAGAMVLMPAQRRSGVRSAPNDAAPVSNSVNRLKTPHVLVASPAAPSADLKEASDVPVQPDNPQVAPVHTASLSTDNAPAQASAMPAVPAPPARATPPSTVSLDSDEIAMLIERGRHYLQNGDLASARLLLQRAAEAGSAAAALSLGATFDPQVIRQLGVVGIAPDPALARQWYEKAAALGSDAASQKLATLDQTN